MDLIDKIEGIEIKIKQVVLKLQQVQLVNTALRKNKEELEAAFKAQKEANEKLQQELAQTKQVLAEKLEKEEEHSSQLRSAIDQYTKEIDRCIEWLTNN